MNTLVVSFFGGPGCGKSIFAADTFARLKWKGILAELVTEYAKDKVYEEATSIFDNQIYMFAKQHHRIKRVIHKTDVIITDSPFLLGVSYIKDENHYLEQLIVNEYKKLRTLNVFLKRAKSVLYETQGRHQTLEESEKIDLSVKNVLQTYKIPYIEIDTHPNNVSNIISQIENLIKL